MKSSKFSNMIWGFIFLGLGLIFLGNNLKLWNINSFFDGWWTLFIILPSCIGILKKDSRILSLVGLFIGILLLFIFQDIISFQIIKEIALPIIFMLLVIFIIFRPKRVTDKGYQKIERNEGALKLKAILSGKEKKISNEFQGVNCINIFGGTDLDLREAKVKKDTLIKVFNFSGSVNILVPKNVNVITSGVFFFGKAKKKMDNNKKIGTTVYMSYITIFGKINIK